MLTRRSALAALPLLAAPALARAQAPIRMTIATGVDPSFAQFYVAREGGIFERNGLDVTVNTGPSGSAMVAFLIGNQINAAYGAEQAGVSAHIVDPNVVVVAEGVALLRWIGVLGRNIASMEELKGRRVGVARGTGSETFWLSVVSKLNLNPADYTIVNVEAPEMVAALERGNIDAYAVWEPWLTRGLRAIPNTRILVSNETIQIIRNFIYMNRGWAEANRPATERFLRAMIEATELIRADRDQAVRHVARFLRQDRALVAELMTKVDHRLELSPDTAANVQLAIDQLRGMGRLGREVTPAAVIWPEALRRVAPERVRL
ncbi:ABC transporter substrate-binding protein [Caldovatus aquaticus]|uniref:NrtA/SsuA/CpmA family ABC transporter substrate-binding protein n=1 Tax=Caldovatus aquaticus TaxID=2865671 RepID=A0ABS7F2V4_9PROT|nr:NrtA/SsuA/CpmA family ABC transporter substrate-binding protein [Caldovatus aquaticus]MBW8269943.1 NrtA/SsuA/CpmA family ABC transporter substrate-binding protein [Caldovatus aquaticus]